MKLELATTCLAFFVHHTFLLFLVTSRDLPSTSTIFLSLDNVKLGIEHFREVQAIIWGAHDRYRNLAYALGVAPVVVSSIIQKNFHHAENCFSDVLTEVLNKGVMQEDLAIALESEMVRHGQLAKRVREATFSPGN